MPRDLFSQPKPTPSEPSESSENTNPELTTSPSPSEELKNRPTLSSLNKDLTQSDKDEQDADESLIRQFSGEVPTMRSQAAASKRDEVHPYTQSLTVADVESCTRLEEACFSEQERASREKFQYRLRACGELCLGIFSSIETTSPTAPITTETSAPVYSGAPNRKAVLLGHLIATKTTNPTIKDEDMEIPSSDGVVKGHNQQGKTIAIHSLAVLPEYQHKGLATTLVKAFVGRVEGQGVGDRVVLLAHEGMVGFYEGLGFENQGKSEATFGGGGWVDMVRVLGGEESD